MHTLWCMKNQILIQQGHWQHQSLLRAKKGDIIKRKDGTFARVVSNHVSNWDGDDRFVNCTVEECMPPIRAVYILSKNGKTIRALAKSNGEFEIAGTQGGQPLKHAEDGSPITVDDTRYGITIERTEQPVFNVLE